jgi:hypothetical protein
MGRWFDAFSSEHTFLEVLGLLNVEVRVFLSAALSPHLDCTTSASNNDIAVVTSDALQLVMVVVDDSPVADFRWVKAWFERDDIVRDPSTVTIFPGESDPVGFLVQGNAAEDWLSSWASWFLSRIGFPNLHLTGGSINFECSDFDPCFSSRAIERGGSARDC